LQYHTLSTKPGIYIFLSRENKILYVGKAKNLKKRVSSYFQKHVDLGTKTSILVSQIAKIKTIIVNSEIEAFILENKYIKGYKPKYNLKLTDDKAYLMVRITIKDEYPKVLTTRRQDDDGSIYFGPYPNNAGALRIVLKTIRKIFPYQSIPNHDKRICLYNHLGLCPCPPVFDSAEFKKEYKKNIKHIIDFLNGKTKKILRELKEERDDLSKNEKFEAANKAQNKINAIELVTGPSYKTSIDLDVDSNLTDDLKEKEINELTSVLRNNHIPVEYLARIECYDISNISGTNATGSMVVFTNGQKDSSQYRKFKIRFINTPNDFGMMEQVLQRRMKHSEWSLPNLVIVDGGKGQVSTAVKVLSKLNVDIPIIGLAKKEETIVTADLKEIILPKDSNALKLIMRIRDEAHRFAITYHRKLRSKSLLPDELFS
jgi:excinuclease ABC subunit C